MTINQPQGHFVDRYYVLKVWALCLVICLATLAMPAKAETYGTELKDEPTPKVVAGIKVLPKKAHATPDALAEQAPQSATSLPVAPAAAGSQSWTLHKGASVKEELEAWAATTGWVVDWKLPHSWVVPNGITYTGDFTSAATTVIQTLAENGIVIRCITNDANKTMLIVGAGVQEQ